MGRGCLPERRTLTPTFSTQPDWLELVGRLTTSGIRGVAGVSPAELVNELDEANERDVLVDRSLSHLEREVCSCADDA